MAVVVAMAEGDRKRPSMMDVGQMETRARMNRIAEMSAVEGNGLNRRHIMLKSAAVVDRVEMMRRVVTDQRLRCGIIMHVYSARHLARTSRVAYKTTHSMESLG
jgi:hypothetical protein